MSEYSEGQTHQLMDALQAAGYTRADITTLGQFSKLGDFRLVLNGLAEIRRTKHIINLDADPVIPTGWGVEEHQDGGLFRWDSKQVQLHLDAGQEKGKYIAGNGLREKLSDKPVLNANVLDYLLANTNLIPEEWRGKAIFFWGTIYRGSDGGLRVRCLDWFGGGWHWGYDRLGRDWGDCSPAALRAS